MVEHPGAQAQNARLAARRRRCVRDALALAYGSIQVSGGSIPERKRVSVCRRSSPTRDGSRWSTMLLGIGDERVFRASNCPGAQNNYAVVEGLIVANEFPRPDSISPFPIPCTWIRSSGSGSTIRTSTPFDTPLTGQAWDDGSGFRQPRAKYDTKRPSRPSSSRRRSSRKPPTRICWVRWQSQWLAFGIPRRGPTVEHIAKVFFNPKTTQASSTRGGPR